MAAGRQPAELPAARRPAGSSSRRRWPRRPTDQVRADDRQPRLPLHLQLLHRLDGGLPAARLRPGERGPRVPADQDEAPDRRLARPELRRAVRRLHGGHRARRCRPAACGTSPRAACRCSPSRTSSGSARTASRPSCPASSRGSTWATSRRPGAPGMDKVRAGRRAREHDPALHPLHPDQLRAGPRHRRGAGAVRAHQAVPRPGAGRVSRPTRCSPRSAGPRRSTSSTSAPAGWCRSRSRSSTTTTR